MNGRFVVCSSVCNCHNRQEPLPAEYLASIKLQEHGIGTTKLSDFLWKKLTIWILSNQVGKAHYDRFVFNTEFDNGWYLKQKIRINLL